MNFKAQLLVLFMLLGLTVEAQKQPVQKKQNKISSIKEVKGLKIGDKVPPIIMNKIVNVDGTLTSSSTAEFNNSLLILDFMYTSCSSCIAGLPKKDHLQRKFGNKIKIMVVIGGETYAPGMLKRENETYIRKFLTNKNSFLSKNNVQIPWVVENKLLNQYFPHQLVSHLVWIYKGKLVAITEQDYVNEANIQYILDGKENNWPIKDDFRPSVNIKKPLLMVDSSQFNNDPDLKIYTAIFGYREGRPQSLSGSSYDSVKCTRRTYIINFPIYNIYLKHLNIVREASGDTSVNLDPSRIILEVKDPEKYLVDENSSLKGIEKRRKTWICYESFSPDTGKSIAEQSMDIINNLNNLLKLNVRFEKRKMKCLILTASSNINNFVSNSLEQELNFDSTIKTLKKVPVSTLVWKLNQYYGNPPVLDETKYNGSLDLELKIDSWKDIDSIRKELNKFGMDLTEVLREVEVFVITEKK